MVMRGLLYLLTATALLASSTANAQPWQKEFGISDCNLMTTGRSQYFVMEPGFQLVLESEDERLEITVLDETKMVDGILARVIEEREWKDDELFEVSRNFFAMCEATKDVFYFGEDVDFYKKGQVSGHEGAWLAGNGNTAGLIMAGTPQVKMRYYQEIAPGVAMDRAEVVSLDETCQTPAGTFPSCLKIKEGTALNVFEREFKYYAPEIGLIQDEDLMLTKHGFVSGG